MRRQRASAAMMTLVAGLFLATAAERVQGADEYSVKATALSHFAYFTTWPDSAFANKDSPIVIGVLGPDPFGRRLEAACKDILTAEGRIIVVARSRKAADLSGCHIVFVSRSEQRNAGGIISALGRNTLIVGDWEGMAASGGAVGMSLVSGRLELTFNPGAARRGGLSMSSKMLRLGRSVR